MLWNLWPPIQRLSHALQISLVAAFHLHSPLLSCLSPAPLLAVLAHSMSAPINQTKVADRVSDRRIKDECTQRRRRAGTFGANVWRLGMARATSPCRGVQQSCMADAVPLNGRPPPTPSCPSTHLPLPSWQWHISFVGSWNLIAASLPPHSGRD